MARFHHAVVRVCSKEVAAELNVSAVSFYRTLVKSAVLVKDQYGYTLSEQYAQYDLTESKTRVYASKSRPGKDHVTRTIYWTELGRRWVVKNWPKMLERADSCPDISTDSCTIIAVANVRKMRTCPNLS